MSTDVSEVGDDSIIRAMRMETARTSETSVDIQLRTRQYIPGDSELQGQRLLSSRKPDHVTREPHCDVRQCILQLQLDNLGTVAATFVLYNVNNTHTHETTCLVGNIKRG
jgi:hypothetical protein